MFVGYIPVENTLRLYSIEREYLVTFALSTIFLDHCKKINIYFPNKDWQSDVLNIGTFIKIFYTRYFY